MNDITEAWKSLRNTIGKYLDQIALIKKFNFRCSKPGWHSNDLMELMRDQNVDLRKASKSKNEQDRAKKTPFYWGSMILNSLPLEVREIRANMTLKDIPMVLYEIIVSV